MRPPLLLLGAAPVILTMLAVPAAVHAGNPRGIAILSPVENPDPYGIAAGGAHGGVADPHATYTPYYSPMIMVSPRWRAKHLVNYYRGYCRAFHHGPYPIGPCGTMPGADCCCGAEEGAVAVGQGDYGGYSGASQDEATLLHLGGAGLDGPAVYPHDKMIMPPASDVVPHSGGDVIPPDSRSGPDGPTPAKKR